MIYHPNMSGYPPNTFLIEQAEHGEGPDAEEVWNLAANMPDPNEQEPPPPPAGLFNSRTDSINSSTVFVNPNLIQPPNSHRYSGATVDQQHQQLQQQQQQQQQQQPQQQQQQPQQQQQQHVIVHPHGGQEFLHASAEDMHSQQHTSIISLDTEHGRRRFSVSESGGDIILTDETNGSLNNRFGMDEDIADNSNHSSLQDNQVQYMTVGQHSATSGPHQGEQTQQVRKVEVPWQTEFNFQPFTQLQSIEPSPTGVDVSSQDYPGVHHFQVDFTKPTTSFKNKHWDYSHKLKKLFIDMNKLVQVEFRIGSSPPPNLLIRTLPVFSEASSIREPVKRCPNHSIFSDATNADFAQTDHLIRYENDDTRYKEDVESGRLSAIFAVGTPHKGTEVCNRMMKFMCLGSDVGGINRRPIKVIFTLEQENRVVGRKVVDVRICSCPKRDLVQEEGRLLQQEENARRIADKFAHTTSVPRTINLQPPPGKKRKMDKDSTIIMVPVHSDDFKKLNEFAEAAWVCRDPGNADQIREHRVHLLRKHNNQLIKKTEANRKN